MAASQQFVEVNVGCAFPVQQCPEHCHGDSQAHPANKLDVVEGGVTAAVRQHRDLYMKDLLSDPLDQALPWPADPPETQHVPEQTKRLDDGEHQK